MRQSKFSESQIIRALKEVDNGATVDSVTRKLGVTATTYYRWKAKYGGGDARRLKQLEDENRRLKAMVAEQALDNQALKAVLAKKW